MKENILKRATIRNARTCLALENLAHYTNFDIERDNKGWDFVQNGTVYGVSGGFFFLSATTPEPSLSRSLDFAYVDASKYTQIVLKYKYVRRRVASVATQGKVQFKTASSPVFDSTRELSFNVIPDGKWHTYTLDMAPVTSWVGLVTNLKIFFATNGFKDDEIFLEFVKIQSDNFTTCLVDCEEDSSNLVFYDDFSINTLNQPPVNWITPNTDASREARVVLDPDNLVNQCVELYNPTTSTSPSLQRSFNTIYTGFLSFRVRTTQSRSQFILYKNTNYTDPVLDLYFDTDGYIKYNSGLSVYANFESPTKWVANQWISILITFDLINLIQTVSINGTFVASFLPALARGGFASLKLWNSGSVANSLYIDDIQLVEETEQASSCKGLGRQGSVTGQRVPFTRLSILKDTNDSIIININGYGDVSFTLAPLVGADIYEVRDELERQISSLDVGGYVYAEVDVVEGTRLRIRSGTYGFDSSVVVKQYEGSTLAQVLGFVDELGVPVYTTQNGRPHAQGLQFSNSFRAKTRHLVDIKVTNDAYSYLQQDPKRTTVEIGAPAAGSTNRKNVISGKNKTIIDFYHRATDEGWIEELYFHGVLPTTLELKVEGSSGQAAGYQFTTNVYDLAAYGVTTGDTLSINTAGYAGNGEYTLKVINRSDTVQIVGSKPLPSATGLTFSIHSKAKIKQFRQKADGSIYLVNEALMGQVGSGLYTRSADTFSLKVNWYVHKGDLIGIYNATSIYTGNDINGSPDCLYLEFTGDLTSSASLTPPIGQGIKSIGLYGRSTRKQSRAIYDIEFDSFQAVDTLILEGYQRNEVREYNLLTAVNQGITLTPTITGTHVHRVFDSVVGNYTTFTHTNIGYNPQTLTDGIKYASNGYLGTFQQTVQGAVYFYISGDGEFADTIEYPPTGRYLHDYIFDYNSDAFNILLSWNVPKLLSKFAIYFKEYPNAGGYYLEWLRNSEDVFDGSRPGFEKIGEGNSSVFTTVKLDTMVLENSVVSGTSAFRRVFEKEFAAYSDINNPGASAGIPAFSNIPYTVLEKSFTPVDTTAFNWVCTNHSSTKIAEIELFSYTDSEAALDEVFEIYGEVEDNTFQKLSYTLRNEETIEITIGFPIKRIRLVVNPSAVFNFRRVYAYPADDVIVYKNIANSQPLRTINLTSEASTTSNSQHIKIQNKTCSIADLEISVSTDEAYDAVLLKTSCKTLEEITNPEIGPDGFLLQDGPTDLPMIENVAMNAECYGLKNLAEGKKYYVATLFENESDSFLTHIEGSKWEALYTNFPQTTPLLQHTFPGFKLPVNSSATTPMRTDLRSRWYALSQFNASVKCSYGAGNTNAGSLGSNVGIEDSTGRRIYIAKSRFLNTTGSFGRVSNADYFIHDSTVGNIITIRAFCTAALCGTDQFGAEDDGVIYLLNVSRITDGVTQDVLRFSYLDTVNGSGQFQWGEDEYFEIDLRTLAVPLVGPLKVQIGNFWSRSGGNATSANNGPEGPHAKIYNFNFGGESTFTNSRFAFEPARTVGVSGTIGIDNTSDTMPIKYVAVDLGQRHYLDIIKIWTKTSKPLWDIFDAEYSDSDTPDVNSVEWGNTNRFAARWLLFKKTAVPLATASGSRHYLDLLRVYPELTKNVIGNNVNTQWIPLGNVLTDGNRNTYISQIDYPAVAVRLANQFDMASFKLLENTGKEFQKSTNPFYGWGASAKYSISSDITNNPEKVVWKPFVDYTTNTKVSEPIKWISWYNPAFSISGGGTALLASEVIVSTRGAVSGAVGSTNDRVDFTEYAEWFQVRSEELNDLALLSGPEQASYSGLLFGGSPAFVNSESVGDLSAPFDGDTTTSVGLQGSTTYLWRTFGQATATSGEVSGSVSGTDGLFDLSTYFITGGYVTYSPVEIDGFSIELADSTAGIPNTLILQKLIATDPALEASWQTIYSETGLYSSVTGTNGEVSAFFNNGEDYLVEFVSPFTVSGLRVVFSGIQFLSYATSNNTMQVSRVSFYEAEEGTFQPLEITNDPSVKYEGRRSLKVTYTQGNSSAIKFFLGGGFSLTPDPLWSIQDFLTFWLRIDRPDLLDFANSFIRLGKDSKTFYEWSLDSLQNQIDTIQLKQHFLKFLSAQKKGEGSLDLGRPDRSQLESQVDFKKGPISFFEVELKPLTEASSDINIWLDQFSITRENFTLPGRFGDTLYLNNSELIYYPFVNLDLNQGYFEVVITPDWEGEGRTTLKEEQAFTLFTLVNDSDESLNVFYDSRSGLTAVVTTATVQKIFQVGRVLSIKKYTPFKLGLAWDSSGKNLDSRSNSNLRVFINDSYVGDFIGSWEVTPSKNVYCFIGARAYQSAVGINTVKGYLGEVAMKLVPKTYSVTGGIENILLSSSPKKLEYKEITLLRDKIEISLNGTDYYSGSDPNLPLIIEDVPVNGEVDLWVRTTFPEDIKNMSREAHLRTRWRLKV